MKQKLFFLIALFLMAVTTSKASYSICPDTFEEEEHTHSDLNEDGLCDECNSLCNLNALMQLEGVTATIVNNNTNPWTASDYTGCTPGIMSSPTTPGGDESIMTLKFSSATNFTLSFTAKTQTKGFYDIFRIFLDNSEALCDVCGEDDTYYITTDELTAGEHTIQFYYKPGTYGHRRNQGTAYVYNIFAQSSCNHEGDTSIGTNIAATCQHGSYDMHVCSICGAQYNTNEDSVLGDHLDDNQDCLCDICNARMNQHVDTNNDNHCDHCGIEFYDISALAQLDGVSAILYSVEGHDSWIASDQEGYMPGLMTKSLADPNSSTSQSIIVFSSETEFKLSFSYQIFYIPQRWGWNDADAFQIYDDNGIVISGWEKQGSFERILPAGSTFFEFDTFDNTTAVIYNISAKFNCHHENDTSEPTHVAATCIMGSYDIHVCSICGEEYQTEPGTDFAEHVDTDNNCVCDICDEKLLDHIDSDNNGDCDKCGRVINLYPLANLHGVTAVIKSEGDYPWAISDDPRFSPGLMSTNYNSKEKSSSYSEITFESQTDFELSFSYICFGSGNDVYYFNITLDEEKVESKKFNRILPAGTHKLTLEYKRDYIGMETTNPNRGYIFDIYASILCDHTGDTSLASEIAAATCAHSTCEIHTCTICGRTYQLPIADDQLAHTDTDNDGKCEGCAQIIDPAAIIKTYKVDFAVENDVEHPWHVSTEKIGIPSLTATDDALCTITFKSEEAFVLSLDEKV